MVHTCPICFKEFRDSWKVKRHLNRKKTCVSPILDDKTDTSSINNLLNCKYCNKAFTYSNNYYRHMKYYCKVKKI